MTIHKDHRRRVKNRFLGEGMDHFEEIHALELLLFYAIPQGDVNPLAHRLVEAFGDLAGVLDASPEALKKVPGVGEHTAVLLKLIPQICGRYLAQSTGVHEEETATRSSDFGRVLHPYFVGATREKCYLLSLDSRFKVLGVDLIGEGELARVDVSSRRVLEAALGHNARSVVLAHNHVGAYANPSVEDLTTTQQLRELLEKVHITLVDHLIFNGGDYTSMRDSMYM
jgi:DNA repair protein RadC